ncbi:36584_t:CDS:2 [Gigaspora margarita]|uniref:36584_t:CDS:1 n=1 Tax=Gigaspora margarita TaxID=4874 RepID=A0ABN7U2Y8_GIGMA|nr:36584_t:CDS:2 [Gigaspora margarita]
MVLNELRCHLKCNGQKYIIRLYGISNNPETDEFIMVMEYADAGSLRDYLIKKRETLNLKDKLKLFEQLSSGLSSIHEVGLIHRDLHPGNVLVNNDVLYLSCQYDARLLLDIANGKHPVIDKSMPCKLTNLIEKCWNSDPKIRPMAIEVLTTISNLIKNSSHTCDDSTSFRVQETFNSYAYTHSTNNSSEQKRSISYHSYGMSRPSIETTYLSNQYYPYSKTDEKLELKSYQKNFSSALNISATFSPDKSLGKSLSLLL